MIAELQLDLFHDLTTEDLLRAELEVLKESHHAIRRRLFAEIAGLSKVLIEQQKDIDALKLKVGVF